MAEYIPVAPPDADSLAHRVSNAADRKVLVSCPETAFGVVHSAEWMSFASPESDFTVERGPGTVSSHQEADLARPVHSAHIFSYGAVDHPETAYGSVHSAEFYSTTSPQPRLTTENVSEEVKRPVTQPKPLDTEFLFSSPASAFGYMHAAELMSEEMKAEILVGRGIEDNAQSKEILFEEFMDTMALMASPESAAGVVSCAAFLDEQARADLFKIQHQVNDLPKTLEDALADPRPVVITEVVHPFSIVDVNDAWVGLCGYEREEALNKNIGKLLQGPETNHQVARTIFPQLMREHFANVVLTNYTKQGRRFRNKLNAGLISDEYGAKYFVGVFEELYDSAEGGRLMSSATA
jgi:PAS domain S-box-containing protein